MNDQLHILIAEDDPDDGQVVCNSFRRHPAFAKVDLVRNGKELMTFLVRSGNNKPGVLLVDINMPVVNGLEALEELSNDSRFCFIPVFVYSSVIHSSYAARCRELGVLGLFVKPSDLPGFDEIPHQLFHILSRR